MILFGVQIVVVFKKKTPFKKFVVFMIHLQNAMAESDDSIDDGQQILSYEHQV